MSNIKIFRNFKSVNLLHSRYARRGEFEIWDANLHDNAIRPFACPTLMCSSAPPLNSLYPLRDCECLGLISAVHPVQGFCPDQHFLIVDGRLRQATETELCAGENGCLAGAPQPMKPGIVSGGCGGCDAVGVAYCITYVTYHAGVLVESAPSEPTDVVLGTSTPGASLSLPTPPDGFCIVGVRIYRITSKFEDGMSEMPIVGSEFVLVGEVSIDTGEFADISNTCATSYPLTTHDPKLFPAPHDILFVTRTENSVVVADLHRVYISTPGQPQFGTEGVVNIEDEIRCIRSIGDSIFVLTDNFPVLIKYRITEGLLSIRRHTIHRRLPLTSYKSVSVHSDVLYFASEYSLYAWRDGDRSGSTAIVSVLNGLMTQHQWKMLDPSTIVGTGYEYGYIFTTKALKHTLMLEFGNDGTDTRLATSLMPISYINADVMDTDFDGHIVYREGTDIKRWDYREQVFCLDAQLQDSDKRDMCTECCPYTVYLYADSEGKNHFRVARIEWDECSAYDIDVSYRQEHFCNVDDLVTQDEPLKLVSSRAFGLPYFVSAQAHSMRLRGCGTIHEVRFATAYADLVNEGNQNVE